MINLELKSGTKRKPIVTGKIKHIRTDSYFYSNRTRCFGWLYTPKSIEKPPVVIMAHGFAAEMIFGLPSFAKRFVEKDIAVFLFDYRNFGRSHGKPRNLVSPHRHIQDWQAYCPCSQPWRGQQG